MYSVGYKLIGRGWLPEAIRFQGVKKLFYAFLPRRKNPCLSEASDDTLKAENSFNNETGQQATAPDR